ncbi:PadR family transcriptional regulator [Paenibacillus sp. TH7-28]
MSSINLVILGSLLNGEKSAYEMVREFENWNIGHWVKISNPSIYKNIIKLHKSGYLNARTVKEGEMPEKTMYEINDAGRAHFYELMEENAADFSGVYFDFSAFIVNLYHMPEDEKRKLVAHFKASMDEKKRMMDDVYEQEIKKGRPGHVTELVELYKEIYGLLHKWSADLQKKMDRDND